MKRLIIATALFVVGCALCNKTCAAAIGTWNIYMAYNDITDIEPAGNMVYVLSSGSLFSYNTNDQSIYAYNKVNSLNDCKIEHIAWNKNAKKLIITYDNYNIDLLDNDGNVENISDYYNKSTTYDKTVNHITIDGIYAYLCTNFGILKVNMRNVEISETYNLELSVTNCAVEGNRIYARTGQGIYSAATADNLMDKSNWQRDTGVDNSIFVSENDIETVSTHGYTERRIYDSTNRCWWSNQENGKLQSYTEAEDGQQTITRSEINPDGPKHNRYGFMKCYEGKLYSCGSYIWDQHYDATIQVLGSDGWSIYQSEGIKEQTGVSFEDMMCLGIDPLDTRHVVGGSRNGVYEFYDGQFTGFHNNSSTNGTINSALPTDPNSKEYELVTAMSFDSGGNLWCFNMQGVNNNKILRLDREGNWSAFGGSNIPAGGHIMAMMFDSKGYMWFTNGNFSSPETYRYDTGSGSLQIYDYFVNQDNVQLEVQAVTSIAEDLDGTIWVGTDKGLLTLTEEQINDPSRGYTQIKVPRNDGTENADYLLSNIDVMGIAVDGANRKWIATSMNGVYLISSDNMEEVEHFTAANSKLISDNLESIAINNVTGEVFFGTDKGLCSYMSDATAANEDMDKDNVYAYPNPVTPGYTGLITIVGLSFNANVKILTSSGTVVAEGTSNGGMFTWDGKDSKGSPVASGVYMVATAKSDGSKGTVCKVAIIR